MIDRRKLLLHRAAWLYVYGSWPAGVIDHINGVKHDNRIANLRDVTRSENQHNRRSHINNWVGCPGVTWSAVACKWRVRITLNNEEEHLGLFSNLLDAIAARKTAKQIYHPTTPAL